MRDLKNNFNKYPEIVKNKQDKTLKRLKHICPYCKSKNVKSMGHSMTLVGSFRFVNNKSVKVKDMSLWDLNHHTFDLECLDCEEKFNKHVRSGNVWYTDSHSIVLLGIPSCFETFYLDCSYCDGHGTVKKIYYKLDGITPHKGRGLTYDYEKGPQQIEAYRCTKCGGENKIKLPPFKKREQPEQILQGWVVEEEIGVLIINDYAIDSIKK